MAIPSSTFRLTFTAAAIAATTAIFPASAQFQSDGVTLQKWIDLGTFRANSGNDCWGYVSPSGREYALMGLSNKTAFVEITDPANSVWIASVNHTDSLWSDIKTYQNFAYVVSEASGVGIQVIDLSDIDNGNVTHVRTVTNPSRSHNVAIDEVSGFLYTCGSNGGSARTVIHDLSDPSNPQFVGTWSTYEHDMQLVTFTSGPNAGRQIMFGASEGRGFDIVDVTNKSNTFLVARLPYTNVTYSHQVWVDADRHYAYLNDELDGINRTSVFDVTDLSNPVHVSDFSSGTGAIDHNEYIRDGILYSAGYTSGLRIMDLNQNPTNAPLIGWFDTHPESDAANFDGAWSCYPFFPSGTVIISDMNRGLFVVDPGGAVGGRTDLTAIQIEDGVLLDGVLGDIQASDDSYVHTRSGFGASLVDLHKMTARVFATTTVGSPSTIDLTVEERIGEPAGNGSVSLWNWNASTFDVVGSFPLGTTDAVHTVMNIAATDYVGDGGIVVQIKHLVFVPFLAFTFESWLDEVRIDVN